MSRGWSIGALFIGVACGPSVGLDGSSGGEEGGTTGVATTAATPLTTSTSPTPATDTGIDTTDETTGVESTGADESTDTGQDESCRSPWPNVTLIACAPNVERGVLAAAGSTVFFENGGRIHSVDVADGAGPALVVEDAGDVAQMVVDGSLLYWVDFGGGELNRVDLDTSIQQTLGDLTKPNSLVVAGSHVFVSEYYDAGSIHDVDVESWSATVLYPGLDYPGRLVRDGSTLYFATSTNDGNVATPIYQGNTTGDAAVLVYSDTGVIEGMLLDGESMFVARYEYGDSSIERTPVIGPDPTEVLVNTPRHPIGFGLTTDRVYWTEGTSDEFGNSAAVRSVPKAGGDVIDHIEHDDPFFRLLVVDGGTVVFRTRDAVARLDR